MKILSWLCLSLSQLLKLPSMPGLGPATAENPLDLLPVTWQGQVFPSGSEDGEQSHCPELLPPFLLFGIPVPVSGLLRAGAFRPQ